MSIKLGLLVAVLLSPVAVNANASKTFPLPFSGVYQSLGSMALELTSRQDDTWKTIPQNVYVHLTKDRDIVELRLKIDVLDSSGQTLYPIENSMWLRHVGDNRLEIYKVDKASGAFKLVGEGACTALSCAYAYVILAYNNGEPYQQRYMSTITWTAEHAGTRFTQAGSLSAKAEGVAEGTDTWLVFKTWSNVFEIQPSP